MLVPNLLKPFLRQILRSRLYVFDLLTEAKRISYRFKRRKVIDAYLSAHSCRKLQIGGGKTSTPGWLNSDLYPVSSSTIFLDAIEPFPSDENSFDYIHCEHMIEHISFQQGQGMLRECFRVLKPGGALRVSTPDLSVYLDLFSEPRNNSQNNFIDWVSSQWLIKQGILEPKPSHVLNLAMHAWGHLFIYDKKTLESALLQAGFIAAKSYSCGESEDVHLRGLETHGVFIGNTDMNEFESLTIEACKPCA